MATSFADILKTTGSSGQRKGLEAYDKRIVTLDDFKIELKGRTKDKEGNPKEQRRVLTARVNTEGLKPRRARIPVRYAHRFMEAMDLRADDAEPFAVRDVRVVVGDHGATLAEPEHTSNGTANGATGRRPGRPRRNVEQREEQREPATV